MKLFQKDIQPEIKVISVKDRTIHADFSVMEVDRDGEVVVPNAFQKHMQIYSKNPVVLWCHDRFRPPVGRVITESLKADNKRFSGRVQFADTEMGREVFTLFKEGALNAFSVGFIPKVVSNDHVMKDQTGRTIMEAELIEVSAVPVPSNRSALATRMHTEDVTEYTKAACALSMINIDPDMLLKQSIEEAAGEVVIKGFTDDGDVDDKFAPEVVSIPEELLEYVDTKDIETKDADQKETVTHSGDTVIEPKEVVEFQNLPVLSDKNWNPEQAVSKIKKWAGGPSEDSVDWDKYRKAFLWYEHDESKLECYDNYKFPVADIVNDKLVVIMRGVSDALKKLNGSEPIKITDTDRKKVYRTHIIPYYKAAGEIPPPLKSFFDLSQDVSRLKDDLDTAQSDVEETKIKLERSSVQPQTEQEDEVKITLNITGDEPVEDLQSKIAKAIADAQNGDASEKSSDNDDPVDETVTVTVAEAFDIVAEELEKAIDSIDDVQDSLETKTLPSKSEAIQMVVATLNESAASLMRQAGWMLRQLARDNENGPIGLSDETEAEEKGKKKKNEKPGDEEEERPTPGKRRRRRRRPSMEKEEEDGDKCNEGKPKKRRKKEDDSGGTEEKDAELDTDTDTEDKDEGVDQRSVEETEQDILDTMSDFVTLAEAEDDPEKRQTLLDAIKELNGIYKKLTEDEDGEGESAKDVKERDEEVEEEAEP